MTYEKLIIFDLDGVLVDSREMHFETLNSALLEKAGEKFVISKEEHLSTYDGLSTTKKLEMLSEKKGLNEVLHKHVWSSKQKATSKWIIENIKPNNDLVKLFEYLRLSGYVIAVASNSIQSTLSLFLDKLGVKSQVYSFVSNEDVTKPKPYPEMYWKCMTECNAIPSSTIIIEDSHIGRQGATDSGARLLPVENSSDVTFDKIISRIEEMDQPKRVNIPWRDSKLNVLIPMAGLGSRFTSAGYTFPKPLIEVNGKPMIQTVVENLNIESNYIFLVQKEHYEKYSLQYLLNLIAPKCRVVIVDGLTEGAACTTLLAKEFINNDSPLLIANSDQFIEWNSNECMYAFKADAIDGGILTFKASHPKWSFAALSPEGFVSEVAEKKVISENATVGVYYWKHGADYVKYAEQMIEKNVRTNQEFYVAPVFNEAIIDNKRFRIKEIEKMWGIGTPEDLNYFLQNYKCS